MLYIEDFDILHVHTPFKWSRLKSYLSLAIRVFQTLRYGKEASYYSHTGIAVWHGSNLYVYEADPQIIKTPYKDWVKNKDIAISRIPFSLYNAHGSNKEELRTIIKSKLGLRYDYISLIIYHVLLILTGRWFGSKNSNAFYCSEFTTWIAFVGTGLFNDQWYKTSPAKSYHISKHNNWICYKGKGSELLEK